MLKKSIVGFLLIFFSINSAFANTLLQGHAYVNKPITDSPIVIHDVKGKILTTKTDNQGFYQIDISELEAPLIVFSTHNLLNRFADNTTCEGNCIVSLANTLQKDEVNTVNINPFTDLLVSEIAKQLSFIGPEQLIDKGLSTPITDSMLAKAYKQFYTSFEESLHEVGITAKSFDPISTNETKINSLLNLILFNRGYDSTKGLVSTTVLFDPRFKPISEFSPFNYSQALKQKNENITAQKRIFILSDSTASNYDKKVYPRMGWGQVFDQLLEKQASVVVINGAQSGRSSRSFYDEGWFDLMVPFMQKGDYMLIAFGHNDEKCDGSNLKRGKADVGHLCTYPNDANNHKQYPTGREDLSFQTSLERFINVANEKGMTSILMTPVTRFRDANNKIAYQNQSTDPVAHTHYTHNKEGFAFWGDYSNTIKQTAKTNNVALIDLEALSIEFANNHKNDWQSYWLVIDPNDPRYPYYKTQSSGVIDHPDITHFQEKGALAIAKIIATAIKNDLKLQNMPIDLNKINQ